MRVEATIPKARGQALGELAEELALSRSQIVDEALALFLKAVMEVRRGRRLVTLGTDSADAPREIVTPTLAQIEWATHRESIHLTADAARTVAELLEQPPEPTDSLKALMHTEA